MEIKDNPSLILKRRSAMLYAENSRVILRIHIPGNENRSKGLINRILKLPEEEVISLLDETMRGFSHRHRKFELVLEKHYESISKYVPDNSLLSNERKLLIGAYFTMEYSVESAAIFNPSIMLHPDQSAVGDQEVRFIMSFRVTGEGHISSIEFRSGILDKKNDVILDAISSYVEIPKIHTDKLYNKYLFQLKLDEIVVSNEVTASILKGLHDKFTFEELELEISRLEGKGNFDGHAWKDAVDSMLWLARSNYEIIFDQHHRISERVIFPVSENESRGIEDARFVRFTDDDGSVTYYATYTAYNGFVILPQLIETKDFIKFKISTLNGNAVKNKGMALFPRRINGKYAMMSRQDGENNSLMYSDDLHFWQVSQIIQEPGEPWEFIQVGNCGSPIETKYGWILLTHGVGPMRKYCIGAELLDLKDPSKILARVKEPILIPTEEEREGYVPNVVYSCGAIIHNDELIIPYAMADSRSGMVNLSMETLLLMMGISTDGY